MIFRENSNKKKKKKWKSCYLRIFIRENTKRYMNLVKKMKNEDKIKSMKLRALLLFSFFIFIVWPLYCLEVSPSKVCKYYETELCLFCHSVNNTHWGKRYFWLLKWDVRNIYTMKDTMCLVLNQWESRLLAYSLQLIEERIDTAV